MTMKRIHVQFTEEEYAQIKSVAFLEDKSFSAVVREGMHKYLKTREPQTEKNAYLSQAEFDAEHGFS